MVNEHHATLAAPEDAFERDGHTRRGIGSAFGLGRVGGVAAHEANPRRKKKQYCDEARGLQQGHLAGVGVEVHRDHGDVGDTASHATQQRRIDVQPAHEVRDDPDEQRVYREHGKEDKHRGDELTRFGEVTAPHTHRDEGARDRLGKDAHLGQHARRAKQCVGDTRGQHAAEHRGSGQAEPASDEPACDPYEQRERNCQHSDSLSPKTNVEVLR